MKDKLRGILRWLNERLPIRIIGIALVVLVVISLVMTLSGCFTTGNWPDCTGLVDYVGPPVEEGRDFERAKSLWDWMGLLIVPLFLGLGVIILNRSQRKSEQDIGEKNREQDLDIAKKNRETDLKIARDRQHQKTLETYFDRMSTLILENGLGTDEEEEGARSMARTRTLSVLRSLGAPELTAVFRFIDDAGLKEDVSLAEGDLWLVNWENADLRGANLSDTNLAIANLRGALLYGANLSGAVLQGADLGGGAALHSANLSGAVLNSANLFGADLGDADLRGANLADANLRDAFLSKADLTDAHVTPEQLATAGSLDGTTMPDGTNYEEWIKRQSVDIQAQRQAVDELLVDLAVTDQSAEQRL